VGRNARWKICEARDSRAYVSEFAIAVAARRARSSKSGISAVA
jgi:hypothetical protein